MGSIDSQFNTTPLIDNINANLSPLASDVAGLFRPYSADTFNNYDNVYLDNSFFIFAPEEYRTYLWRIVRRNMLWYRGFVPGLHNQGVLSSKLGTRICKRVSELIMAGGFRVEGHDEAERFIEKWIKNNKIRIKLTTSLPDLNAIGNMLVKLDFKADNSLTANFIPGNKYFATVDNEANVEHFVALIEYIAPDAVINANMTTKDEQGYYLVEQRKMIGTKCYQRYAVYRAAAAMTQAVFTIADEINPNRLPKRIKNRIDRIIGIDKLGPVFEMPFKNHIGAVVVLNSATCTSVDYAGFSDSTLADCHTQLYQYDITNTQKEGNKFFAQTGVLIPDTMIPPEIANNPSGNAQATYLRNQSTLDGRIYKKIPLTGNATGEANKPVFYQADNQAQVYNEDLKDILSNIATLCGLTPTALAGNLTANGDRTATEVVAEDDITRATIETKRDLIREPLTQFFRWVLDHYNIENEDIDMIFNSSILNNPERETEDIINQINGGIMSPKTGIARKNRNYSKKEVEEELAEIEENQKRRMMSGADGLWNAI